MEHVRRALEGFPEWSRTPIPGISLSAGGLLALADLSTVAQRTAIAGGASWLDSLLLAPGLHYQQAADALARGGPAGGVVGVEQRGHRRIDGGEDVGANGAGDGEAESGATVMVNNTATLQYLRKIARPGEMVTIDVGTIPQIPVRSRFRVLRKRRRSLGADGPVWAPDDGPDLGRLSHVLYLVSPVLTVAAMVFTILLQDWWALGFIGALMLSRILNIIVIKGRTAAPSTPPTTEEPQSRGAAPRSTSQQPNPQYTNSSSTFPVSSSSSSSAPGDHFPHPFTNLHAPTTLLITLPDGRKCRLRGLPSDLAAITTTSFLAATTHIQGYLEAAAKLLVWAAAALSGNATQAGSLCLMGLLLATAALLGLSNAHAKGVRTNGRVAVGEVASGKRAGSWPGAGTGMDGAGGKRKSDAGHANSWPAMGHAQATNGAMRPGGVVSRPAGRTDGLGARPGADNWHPTHPAGADPGDWAETGQAGSHQNVGDARPFNDAGDYN